MKTVMMHGVECVIVRLETHTKAAHVEAIGLELFGNARRRPSGCFLCPAAMREPGKGGSSCTAPGDQLVPISERCPGGQLEFLVRADVYPLLKLRAPPGTFD